MKIPFFIEKYLAKNLSQLYAIIHRTVSDTDGNVISHKQILSKSFVRNFMHYIYLNISNGISSADWGITTPAPSSRATKYTGGTWIDYGGNKPIYCNGSVGNDNLGIIIGTGTTPPTPDDYKIETLIPHGTGAGQMAYQQVHSVNGVTVSGNDVMLKISRIFINNSGGTIQPSEVCLYGTISGYSNLISRDVFSADTVLNTQTYTIDLEFKYTT